VRACTDPKCKKIIGVLASQMGRNKGVLNVIGYRLVDDPVPILYAGPTRSNVEKVIELRFLAVVRAAKELRERLGRGHQSTETSKPTWALIWIGVSRHKKLLAEHDLAIGPMREVN
jgi:phage terminase large subunit GpA-like protein